MLWLAIDIPALPLLVHTRAQRPEPHAGAQPQMLAVVAEGRVLACNAAAAAAGVMPGQGTASALALCPSLRFLEHLPQEEVRLLLLMAEACFSLTPTVVLAPPHSILLEVGGCLQLFRGQAGLLRQLQKRLRPFGAAVVLAQGPTAKAALLLAQGAQAQASLALLPPSSPLTMAMCLPLLQQVPVQCLPWDREQQRKLQRLHIRTLGELLALPRASVSKRLGVAATRYIAALLGEVADPQELLVPAEDFQAGLHFLDGISHAEGLRFPMRRLLEDFCRFLRQRQFSCARFHWRFTHQDKSRQQLLIASARGEPQVGRFLTLSELQLENFRISAPIESITLVAHEFQAQADTRLTLLPDPGQEDEQALALLDRLRARLGTDACQRLSPQNHWRPEREQAAAHEFCTDAVASDGALRPFWIWPEAKPVRVMADGLWWQGAFALLSGPERIALPWWEDGDSRDYYLARHDNGGHYWLYFSANAGAWFCQGLFG
jgi:protein ImuB